MLNFKRIFLVTVFLIHGCMLRAQIGSIVFAITTDGTLFMHNDTITLKDAAGLASIHAFDFYKEKVFKLNIKEFQMTIIRDNEPDVTIKGSGTLLHSGMKLFLNKIRCKEKEIIPVAFEGIFAENTEPGPYFGIRRAVPLLRLYLIDK